MWKYKDFKYENVREVFRGHLLGAAVGGIVGYLAYLNFGQSITFAVTPLEKAVEFVKATDAKSIIIVSMIVALSAFIGAFIQSRGKY